MSNIRKAVYNADHTKIALSVNGKRQWFNASEAVMSDKPNLYVKRIGARNYYFGPPSDIVKGMPFSNVKMADKNISRTIPPISFGRPRTDLMYWRQGIIEAETLPFQYRVIIQQILQDVILDPFIRACWDKRKRLTLQKKPYILDIHGNPTGDQPDFLHSAWWNNLLSYILDAQGFGYQLISLGDMINKTFPSIDIIPRQNISPDREVVVPTIYQLGGKPFNGKLSKTKGEEKDVIDINSGLDPDGRPWSESHIWVKTPSEVGSHITSCGYGMFYYLAPYYMALRDNLQFNMDFLQLCIEPIRKLKTSKTDETERKEAYESLLRMGRSMAILMDKEDDLELLTNPNIGPAAQSFGEFETRMQGLISIYILGHSDTTKPTPGKLGSQQGGQSSPQQLALSEIEAEQDKWLSSIINDNVFPKLRNLGIEIPAGVYGYKNDNQINEEQDIANKQNLAFAQVVQELKNAGFTVPADYIEDVTGIPVEKSPTPIPENNNPEEGEDEIKATINHLKFLKNQYGHTH